MCASPLSAERWKVAVPRLTHPHTLTHTHTALSSSISPKSTTSTYTDGPSYCRFCLLIIVPSLQTTSRLSLSPPPPFFLFNSHCPFLSFPFQPPPLVLCDSKSHLRLSHSHSSDATTVQQPPAPCPLCPKLSSHAPFCAPGSSSSSGNGSGSRYSDTPPCILPLRPFFPSSRLSCPLAITLTHLALPQDVGPVNAKELAA